MAVETSQNIKVETPTELVGVCLLDFSHDAIVKIVTDLKVSQALMNVEDVRGGGNVWEDFAMLEWLDEPGSMYSFGEDRFSYENRQEWTYEIPSDLFQEIKDLIKDLPWEGRWTI